MSAFNIERALHYLKQGELNQVQHYLEQEMAEQETYFPITRFCLDDLNEMAVDREKLDQFDAAYIAESLGECYLENGYWTDLAEIVADRFPHAMIDFTVRGIRND